MKVTFVVAAALGILVLLRHRSAALRHWVLAATLGCAAVLPVLETALPVWTLPFAAPPTFETYTAKGSAVDAGAPATRRFTSPVIAVPDTSATEALMVWDLKSALATTWVVGIILGFGILVIGVLRLSWIAAHASRIDNGRWRNLADEIARTAGFRRPVVLLQSSHPSLLVTWGLVRPKVILPAHAAGWSDARARVVLTHELAHIRRGDWIVQFAAEVFRAIYWFNPLVWIACRRLRLESERACDDEVMSQGVKGTEYAHHLVELARALGHSRHRWLPAPAMARPSSLERRVRAMLNERINRTPMSGVARAAVVAGLLALTGAIAAAQSGFVSFSGSVFDEQHRGIPGVALVLTNEPRQAKYEVKTNESGRFEFVGLPAGEYRLEVRGNGFGALGDAITVAGQNLHRDLTLSMGTIQETIRVLVNDRQPPSSPIVKEVPMPGRKECTPSQAGGRIVPPRKIRDVSPQYPAALRGTGTEGVVNLKGRIGLDGYIGDIQVVGDAQPDLAQAAIAAVREWLFTETLLNCQPVEVTVSIGVHFQKVLH